MSQAEFDLTTSCDFVAMVGDEVYTIFRKGTRIPHTARVILYELYTVRNNSRILLFYKDGVRQYRFAVVILNEVPSVFLAYPLEISFKIETNGILETIWSTGSAKVVYDFDHYDLDYVRRRNLRI